ncbi:hypothetical protein [Deinococcus multiflagellatus]|uniref:Uncharacterized protein n=1 Tax=Deinococcus multiflagellatus TaxID=1656887 RepID=A0ABW1ZHF4_9DEIO|nr:hypothetical protein [Deinococcus multiflagellatus]MBZ9711836.1 hypothetical protein [Deinococcus multiflagellatus]
MRRAPLLTVLALPLGYGLGWFLFGLPGGVVLAAGLGAALGLAAGVGGARGVAGFLRLLALLLLAAGMLWLLGGGLLLLGMTTSPNNPLPIGLGGALVLLGPGAVLLWLLGTLARRLAQGAPPLLASPAAPFVLVGGAVLFAFAPAVRVDCRGLQGDSFLRPDSGFSGASAAQTFWARRPALIPGRAELPADFVVDGVRASVTRCFRDQQGRPRPLTLRASAPLLVVHLTERVRPGMRAYAAVFTPGEHRKLTPWQPTEPPYSAQRVHRPYHWPGWVVFPDLPELPPALEQALPPSSGGR